MTSIPQEVYHVKCPKCGEKMSFERLEFYPTYEGWVDSHHFPKCGLRGKENYYVEQYEATFRCENIDCQPLEGEVE